MTPQIQQPEQAWLIPTARTETKPEAMKRGREIVRLSDLIERAPIEEEAYREQTASLLWFATKAKAHEFDENSQDGLMRLLGGDVEELECCEDITEADYRAMREDKSLWKEAVKGHLSYPPPFNFYCTTMHPKEIAALETLAADCEATADAIGEAVAEYARQLEELRAVCPLPQSIADKLKLTVDGHKLKGEPNAS